MTLKQVIITWLLIGFIGVCIDLFRNSKDYKGTNLLHALGYFIVFVLGGGFTFSIALSELIEDKKKKK